jgi:hypothetical protein
MPFVTPLELRYVGVGRYRLTEPLVYAGAWDTFTVPAGVTTDLASVPRVVRWLIPQDGAYTASAVLHDWLCELLRRGTCPISSRDVDGLFRRCCREAGTPLLARWLLWTGVRWGALFNPARRRGWLRDAPAVLALSLLAAPLVVPASLVVLAALAVYAVAEALVSLFDPTTGGAA